MRNAERSQGIWGEFIRKGHERSRVPSHKMDPGTRLTFAQPSLLQEVELDASARHNLINGPDFFNGQGTPPHASRRACTTSAEAGVNANAHLDLECVDSRGQIGCHEIEVMSSHRVQDQLNHLVGHYALGGDGDDSITVQVLATLDQAAVRGAQGLSPLFIYLLGRKRYRMIRGIDRLTIQEDADLQR